MLLKKNGKSTFAYSPHLNVIKRKDVDVHTYSNLKEYELPSLVQADHQ